MSHESAVKPILLLDLRLWKTKDPTEATRADPIKKKNTHVTKMVSLVGFFVVFLPLPPLGGHGKK